MSNIVSSKPRRSNSRPVKSSNVPQAAKQWSESEKLAWSEEPETKCLKVHPGGIEYTVDVIPMRKITGCFQGFSVDHDDRRIFVGGGSAENVVARIATAVRSVALFLECKELQSKAKPARYRGPGISLQDISGDCGIVIEVIRSRPGYSFTIGTVAFIEHGVENGQEIARRIVADPDCLDAIDEPGVIDLREDGTGRASELGPALSDPTNYIRLGATVIQYGASDMLETPAVVIFMTDAYCTMQYPNGEVVSVEWNDVAPVRSRPDQRQLSKGNTDTAVNVNSPQQVNSPHWPAIHQELTRYGKETINTLFNFGFYHTKDVTRVMCSLDTTGMPRVVLPDGTLRTLYRPSADSPYVIAPDVESHGEWNPVKRPKL